ncbi:MAG: Uncharacterized protein Greene101447_172 [Parcubacteria group bacterium Greene1014_47]|nr:MAG: Uncharacterized protein Greene101447_172 [Parcubacteria group bacterium Greene1014_47]
MVNSKRAKFPRGLQRRFIQKVLINLSFEKVAGLCGVSQRTIRDWRREKFLMDFSAVKVLCNRAKLPFPQHIKLKDRYWYTSKGAKYGWSLVLKKYGRIPLDEEYRKEKWYEWWEREGRYKRHPIINVSKPIRKPAFSKELAEFVGIVLGDGGISKRQITVSLHSIDDKEYSHYVSALIKKLFLVPVSIRPDKNAKVVDLVISRTELIRFCTQTLGLRIGNKVKQQVDVPHWIKHNKSYILACTRGLVDTDGSVYLHRYKVNGKWYTYSKLSFSNRSMPLLQFVLCTFKTLGMNPRLTKYNEAVRLESKNDMKSYFGLIGTHNPKYLKKYRN